MSSEVRNAEKSRGRAVAAADFIATGFYSGCVSFMPGTVGTAAAVVLTMVLHYLVPFSYYSALEYALFAVFTVGGWVCTQLVLDSGKYGEHAKDPQSVVVDEFAGYYLVVAGAGGAPQLLLLGFLIFRVFDILKPPPLTHFERLPGAWGVMADDLGAGVYGALIMHFAVMPFLVS